MNSGPCPVNEAVLTFLRRRLNTAMGNETISEASIESLLRKARADEATIDRLAHTVAQWAKPKDAPEKRPTPKSDKLLELAEALDVSLDEMVGHTLRNPPVHSGVPAAAVKDWLREFLAQCYKLSCYVVFVPTSTLAVWEAQARNAGPDEDQRIALAQEWAKQIHVFAASVRLSEDHKFGTGRPTGRQTMDKLLRHRLSWIGAVKNGKRLEELARREAYLGIYNAVSEQHGNGEHERYPSKNRKRVLSLRVRFDSLPVRDHEVGWLVYYNWGPPLSDERVQALLAAGAPSAVGS